MYVEPLNGQGGLVKGEMCLFLFSSLVSLWAMISSGQRWYKAAATLKVSDKENVVENQIKGEGHLWCTPPADTAL